jgi:hypothetical protein
MGTSYDLSRLAEKLKSRNCSVLLSKANENIKSLRGIETCASDLVNEIVDYLSLIHQNNEVKYLSFVGNSMGGLFIRNAIKLIQESSEMKQFNFKFHKFLTIASPHLGVLKYDLFEGYLPKSQIFRRLAGYGLLQSGKDLMSSGNNSLLYQMATQSAWLNPLKEFKQRRLYVNLFGDSVVPLATGGIMTQTEATALRKKYKHKYGIVHVVNSSLSPNTKNQDDDDDDDNTCIEKKTDLEDGFTQKMIDELNGCDWEKVLVHFEGNIPLAHNKICALTRDPTWLFDAVMGFNQGEFVMDHASDWLCSDVK